MDKKQLKSENQALIRMIRNSNELWNTNYSSIDDGQFKSPINGTTSTFCSSHGKYPVPVYYDWNTNWDEVSKVMHRSDVQEILKQCIENARNQDENEFSSCSANTIIYPFIYFLQGNYGEEVKSALSNKYLPKESIQEYNNRIAHWYNAIGKRLIKEEGISLLDAEDTYERDLMDEKGSGRKLMQIITISSDRELLKIINNASSPMREMLLCAPTKANAFTPFNYKLAELLSPVGTKLSTYANEYFSIVIDEERNIVYDNFAYFSGVPAYKALFMAKFSFS